MEDRPSNRGPSPTRPLLATRSPIASSAPLGPLEDKTSNRSRSSTRPLEATRWPVASAPSSAGGCLPPMGPPRLSGSDLSGADQGAVNSLAQATSGQVREKSFLEAVAFERRDHVRERGLTLARVPRQRRGARRLDALGREPNHHQAVEQHTKVDAIIAALNGWTNASNDATRFIASLVAAMGCGNSRAKPIPRRSSHSRSSGLRALEVCENRAELAP